jgi:cyanophycinase
MTARKRGRRPERKTARTAARNGAARGGGTLVIVGGREDKENELLILAELARRTGRGALVVATVASQEPDELWKMYAPIFRGLGISDVRHLDVEERGQSNDGGLEVLDAAQGVFFTGGDQLRITSLLGGSVVAQRIREIYESGGVVAGTSAGAAVMSATMLVGPAAGKTHRLGDALHLAPGLGLLPDVIIDQHFTERGRIGRLLGAVAQNPRALGVGIDEDTAMIVEGPPDALRFGVIGAGAVYVADGRETSYTNVADVAQESALSLFDLRLHVLSSGDTFDVATRRPTHGPPVRAGRTASQR